MLVPGALQERSHLYRSWYLWNQGELSLWSCIRSWLRSRWCISGILPPAPVPCACRRDKPDNTLFKCVADCFSEVLKMFTITSVLRGSVILCSIKHDINKTLNGFIYNKQLFRIISIIESHNAPDDRGCKHTVYIILEGFAWDKLIIQSSLSYISNAVYIYWSRPFMFTYFCAHGSNSSVIFSLFCNWTVIWKEIADEQVKKNSCLLPRHRTADAFQPFTPKWWTNWPPLSMMGRWHTRNIDTAATWPASLRFSPMYTPCTSCYSKHRQHSGLLYPQHLQVERWIKPISVCLYIFQMSHLDAFTTIYKTFRTDLCREASGPAQCSLHSWSWCCWCRVHSAGCTLSLWHLSSNQTERCMSAEPSW